MSLNFFCAINLLVESGTVLIWIHFLLLLVSINVTIQLHDSSASTDSNTNFPSSLFCKFMFLLSKSTFANAPMNAQAKMPMN